MNAGRWKSGSIGLGCSIAVIWAIILIMHPVIGHYRTEYANGLPDLVPIPMFFISNQGMIDFGVVLSLSFVVYWFLATLFCRDGFLKIRQANTALLFFFAGFLFMTFEKINQDYLNESIFCRSGEPRRLEFDISWACERAYYAENTAGIVLVLLPIFSFGIRVYFSRKDAKLT
ncbi:hypothetical protein [Parasphingorhabdus sp.]|uniref:hypothetical protein n=1 Tax=Parasphingorhabdus sp. TaxID=2709688 RepID=UPI003265A859